jgi:thiamine biosynthesis lipoprotein
VGIRHPRRPGAALATLPLFAGGVASSGDYERCMVVDGKRYAHILDPRTGWPVEGLIQVSVVSRHCLIAGTASTIAMLKGPRAGIAWLDDLGLPNLRVARDGSVSGTLQGACGAASDAASGGAASSARP